jgi:hypothetical protein
MEDIIDIFSYDTSCLGDDLPLPKVYKLIK